MGWAFLDVQVQKAAVGQDLVAVGVGFGQGVGVGSTSVEGVVVAVVQVGRVGHGQVVSSCVRALSGF